jgi:hypothetical protein
LRGNKPSEARSDLIDFSLKSLVVKQRGIFYFPKINRFRKNNFGKINFYFQSLRN